MLSLVIPVYKNEENLDRLLEEMVRLDRSMPGELEIVFVVDGSPDACFQILQERLPALPLRYQLLSLSRNFGSFNAITAGLAAGFGDRFAVLAADLQEPPALITAFNDALKSGTVDIVFGCRGKRADPWLSEMSSSLFWWIYRTFVIRDMPKGGVDVFGCNRTVRDHVLRLKEANTSLVVLLFWLGFRRGFITYERRPRLEGRSAWTFASKFRYCVNSIFNFTDLPIRLLTYIGASGFVLALVGLVVVTAARLSGRISVPGYTVIALLVLVFGSAAMLGMGILGQYLWLCLQNVRKRPNYIVAAAEVADVAMTDSRDSVAPTRNAH